MAALNDPLSLPCGVDLPNRLAKSAMSEQLGDAATNAPTDKLVRLYERWSAGGAGMLITGNVMVDRRALGEPRNVVVDDDRDFAALQAWADAATQHGTQALVQINHPGRQSPRMLSRRPVAPSAVPLKGLQSAFAKPRTLTDTEIHQIINAFATTAETVVRAGFTGVQIHGAHGYLVSQFLSPLTNQRQDAWGGDPERRRRFLVEIVRAVRDEIGGQTPLGVKLNSADFQRGGFTEEESMAVVETLEAEGVDLLEISGGTYERAAMVGDLEEQRESTREREAYFLEYARKVRERTRMPLMLTGGLRSSEAMNAVLEEGAVDVIGIARPMVVEPELPATLLNGGGSANWHPRRIGFKRADAIADLQWHTQQIWRLGAGLDPDPERKPLAALAAFAAAGARDSATRMRHR
ncbi:MAG: NADH:flavin oxidoreductase/NADH oxidase family protein [Solirubrobacteraceae bacterium]|nr:NADH:flavin oxidoreductase/NADH oxidase family protein [Solirubrobacteraceae bacterium]